jgi:hypothetical protein
MLVGRDDRSRLAPSEDLTECAGLHTW